MHTSGSVSCHEVYFGIQKLFHDTPKGDTWSSSLCGYGHDLSRDESDPSLVHPFREISRASSPHPSESQEQSKTTNRLQYSASALINSAVETFATMTTTLKEQAWQSSLVLSDDKAEWNENDWPSLEGGWRDEHARVVLDHPDEDDNNKNNGQTVVVLGGYQQDQGTMDSVLLLNLADPVKQWREGPSMNKARYGHAALACNGGVYVMGGYNGAYLACMERIDANDLLQSCFTSSTTHASNWTRLS